MTADVLGEPTKIECKRSDLKTRVLPFLHGRIFHVTSARAFASIRADKSIKNSRDHQIFSPWRNSYGPKHGYVCLLDFQRATEAQIEHALLLYSPFPHEGTAVYLFLSEQVRPKLISDKEGPGMALPDVEVWYPEDIPINLVSDTLMVTVQPDNGFYEQMREAQQKALEKLKR